MEEQVDDPGGPGSQAVRKKQKTVPNPEEKGEKKNRKGEVLRRRRQERQLYNEMVVNTSLLGHVKDPCREKLRDAKKTCRFGLQEYYRGVVSTNEFGEGDARRRDAHGNGRDSGRVFRKDLCSLPHLWYSGSAEGKCASGWLPRKLRGIPLRG